MRWKKFIVYIALTILILLVLLYFLRAFSEKQIDDISPEIQCEKELLKKSDIFYVIPKLNNQSIANNKTWCNEILKLNKKLSLHGVYHNYHEFEINRNKEYIQEGLDIFQECFNQTPNDFKPPQLAISKNNKKIIQEEFKLKVKSKFNQLFHKVYHCKNTGIFSNRFIDWF
jgi:hypothetical protein